MIAMESNGLYKTKRVICINASENKDVLEGEYYPVYMDYTSTDGILDENEEFIPLAKLYLHNVKWERVK